jgi:hypothetical protein
MLGKRLTKNARVRRCDINLQGGREVIGILSRSFFGRIPFLHNLNAPC